MPEPFSFGALAATTLSAAAGALGKEVATQAVKSAYASLKGFVSSWVRADVEQLERDEESGDTEDSEERRTLIASKLDRKVPPESQSELIRLSRDLEDALSAAGITTRTAEVKTATAGDGGIANAGTFIADKVTIGAPSKSDKGTS